MQNWKVLQKGAVDNCCLQEGGSTVFCLTSSLLSTAALHRSKYCRLGKIADPSAPLSAHRTGPPAPAGPPVLLLCHTSQHSYRLLLYLDRDQRGKETRCVGIHVDYYGESRVQSSSMSAAPWQASVPICI